LLTARTYTRSDIEGFSPADRLIIPLGHTHCVPSFPPPSVLPPPSISFQCPRVFQFNTRGASEGRSEWCSSAQAGIHSLSVSMYHPCLLSSVSQRAQRAQIVVDRVSFIHAAMTGSTRCHSLSYSTRSSILSASMAFCMLEAGT